MQSETQNQIGVLKVRGAPRDDPALRLAVSSQLGQVEFRPPGMPPSAILIVRRLDDPLPGQVPIRRADQHHCTDWNRRVKDRMGVLYRGAVSPRLTAAAELADAVIFTDPAELLACLSLDLSRKAVGRRWWWRSFSKQPLASASVSEAIRQLFIEKVVFLPAVLDHLTRQGNADSVMHAVSKADALQVLSALIRAYSLEEMGAVFFDSGGLEPTPAIDGRSSFRHPNFENPKTDPWRQWLATSHPSPDLATAPTCLWGLGLVLHRMPSLAQSSKFQQNVIHWWRQCDGAPAESKPPSPFARDTAAASNQIEEIMPDPKLRAGSADPPSIPGPKTSPEKPSGVQAETHPAKPSWKLEAETHSSPPEETDSEESSGVQAAFDPVKASRKPNPGKHLKTIEANRLPQAVAEPIPGKPIRSSSTNTQADAPSSKKRTNKPPAPAIAAKNTTMDAASPGIRESEAFILTRLGGVLYLINLMTQLDLPHCFENDWRLAGRLGAWGLLELLGRALLEPSSGPHDQDPIWTTLADLDGRGPGPMPGNAFTGHEAFRIPVFWYQQVRQEGDAYRWAAMRRRLRIWSDAGYLLLEIDRDDNAPHHQAQAELRRYLGRRTEYPLTRSPFSKAPVDCPPHLTTSGYHEGVLRWLALCLSFIRYRLRLAFEQDSGWHPTMAEQVFACPGKLYVTATHVDFLTDINHISIPVRKAGLDRDPGWNPDLGRVVLFHFE